MDSYYWIGQDGNVWVQQSDGTAQNVGRPLQQLNGGIEAERMSIQGTQIPDPATTGGGGSGGGGGSTSGGGGGYTAPAKVLDSAGLSSLDALMARLGVERDQLKSKYTTTRNTNLAEKREEKKREKGKFDGKKLSTLQDFAGAKTDTDLNTRNTLENLMSSLSTLGLGGSRALTRQILDAANMSNRKANATQATNNRDLDSAFNDYTAGNENDVRKINDQFGFDSGEAERKYNTEKQTTLYKKADIYGNADMTNERTSMMSQGDGLNSLISGSNFLNPSYTGKSRAMATPELGDYTQDIAKYNTTGITGANADTLTPVSSDGMNAPGNLAVRAIAVNDKDLGIKKKTEDDLGYGI